MRNLLGGKGAGLAEMTNIGLPIPDGFTISTEACTDYYEENKTINEDTQKQIFEALSMAGRKSRARNSATRRTRCSCRCVPAPAHPCLA
jgi:phosphoenolpyruvate synthase/pyruvate phosphate dikinase